MRCDAGYYLPAGSYECALCPAGRYCTGGTNFAYHSTQNKGLSGYVAAGYYSTGGASKSKPAAHGNGCYGQVDGQDTACGLIAGGYYSTGGGTVAAPTGVENGCLTGNTCGILSKDYFSNGGGTKQAPSAAGDGCVTGQFCGICPAKYRASTTTGKTNITACMASCSAGQWVVTAENSTENNASAAGCITPNTDTTITPAGNKWWSNAHDVYYGSASPVVNTSNDIGVHACASGYSTPDTTSSGDHNEMGDCTLNITLYKNGGTTIDGATWPDGVTDGTTTASRVCQEGVSCALGNPALLLEKPGWTFQNAWGTNASCTGTTYESPVASPLTSAGYYACKNQIDYTLTYACGTGTGTAPAQQTQIHYGNTVTVAAVGGCAKTGHHFTGWAVSDSEDVVQPGSMTWNYTDSKTFTAQWAPNVYGISYVDNGGVRTVPDGYTLVDYIESDGGQVIDTGIMGLNKRVVLDAMYTGTNVSSYKIPVSYYYDYLGTYAAVYNNKWGVYNSSSYLISGAAINNRKTVEIVFDLNSSQSNRNRATITINGTSKSYTRSDVKPDATLKLFSDRVAASSRAFIGRIYNAKIYDKDTGELLFNGVPARNSSGELGLYDTVSGTFFTNLGTGNPFTAGDDVTDAYPMEYTYGVGATVYGVPTREHSVFEGWCRNAALTENCTTPHEITTTDIDPKTLYAKWACAAGYHLSNDGQSCVGNQITVQYSKNGHGTESVPANQTCTYGSTVILANGLTEQGWWFMGWNVPNVGTFDAGETIPCDVDHLGVTSGTVTLSANWEPWCNKITLNKNNSSASYGSIRYLYAKTREAGDTTNGKWYKNDACTVEYTSADYASVIPSRDGWAFRGFYASNATDINATQTNGANRVMTHTGAPTNTTGQNFVNNVNANTVLYAGWAQDCADPVAHGTCVRTLGQNTTYTTTCDTGYHYDPAASESTYNPICVADTISIVLNKNGGTGTCGGAGGTTSGTMTCYYDGTCNTPIWNSCSISNGARIFTGWNTESDGTGTPYGSATIGVGIDTTDPTILANGLTLYAQWADVTCNVSHGTATARATTTNTPTCWVDSCDNGYSLSANPPYYGTQHETTVDTGQCTPATYDITYHENGGTRVLPDGYTRLSYLTFSGEQYIDTGVVLTDARNIENVIEMQSDLLSGLRTWTGFMNTSGSTPRYGINFYSNKWMIGINKTSSNGLALDTVKHTLRFVTTDNTQTLYDTDGTTVLASADLNANALSSNVLSLYIGARHQTSSVTNFAVGRIGRTYLKQNGLMLYDFVPARRDNDNKLGMYDTVSGTFFTNAATSGADFTAGPAISEEYTLLDYIQSSGTQYIVTDFVPTTDFKHTIVFEGLNSSSTSTYITGTTYTAGRAGNTRITSGKIDRVFGNDPSNSNSSSNYVNLINPSNNISVVNTKSVLVMDLHNNAANTITLNGTDITSSNTGTITSTSALSLFAYGAGSYKSTIRLYRSTIEQGGVVVHNYVPARRNSDGELGVYDVITGNFFTNAGTGTFVAPDTVLVSTQAEYPDEYMYGIGAMVYGVPVREHSIFEGWCRNAALTENCTSPHEIGTAEYGDKDLYAKWSCVTGYHLSNDGQSCVGNNITITYQKGTHGVGNPPSAVTRAYGSTLQLASAMGDPQWTFTGWQINGNLYNEGENITLDFDTLGVYSGNVNAVAQWEAEVYTVHYNCGTTWPNAVVPADGHPTTNAPFTAAQNSCENPGYRFVGWLPESDWQSTIWVNGTVWNLINGNDPTDTDVTFTAQWERDDPAFTVTVDVPAGTTFSFDTFASGQFWVDWGDGSTPSEFETATVVAHTWSHTYTTADTYVIGIGGRASGYFSDSGASNQRKAAISFFNGTLDGTGVDVQIALDDNEQPLNGSEQYIVSANGSLGAIFPTLRPGTYGGQPRFYRTFKNTFAMTQSAQNLVNLFDGIYGDPVPYMFAELFDGSAITGTIPAGLFPVDGTVKTALFLSTFRNCAGLSGTIPADLFKNIAGAPLSYMFSRTFRGCTNLTGIPVGLFRNISGAPAAQMFSYTFEGCSNITGTLSKNLFGNIDGAPAIYMFARTFSGCTKLQGDTSNPEIAIPDGMFGNLSGSAATYMFYYTFNGCSNLTGRIGGALFSGLTGNPAEYMFQGTFMGCSKLTGSIPNNLFGNMTGAPAQDMFNSTFKGCSKLSGSIPSRLFGSITGLPQASMFASTFNGCSDLTGVIPANLFENISGRPVSSMFYATFKGCSKLAGIGGALFSGINGASAGYMFDETFSGCTSLSGSIPDGLFGTPNNTPATYMFYRTFYNCSGLTGEIPARLFGTPKGAPKTYMFRETFYNCSGLTGTIPSTLFGGAVTSTSGLSGSGVGYMFYGTFRNCTNLSGYVPEDLFGNLTKSSTSYQMSYVFADSGLLTECPCGTIDVSADNTFYSTYWRSTAGAAEPRKVACRVDTTSGNYYWYNNQCSTICPLDTMDELHAGNTSYTVLASKLTDVAINVKYGDTTCYVPLTAGNGGANSLNMTYNNTVYHADRPGTMPPAGFGQR